MKQTDIPFIEGLENMPFDILYETMSRCGAAQRAECVPWSEYPYLPQVRFSLAASRSHLFVCWSVRGEGLKALFGNDQEPVWQDSCVETFIAAPDGSGYFNFEMNCIGTLLAAHQRARGVDTVRLEPQQMTSVIRHTSLPHETFEERSGIHSWRAATGIPFSILGFADGERPATLRANFYKCADGSATPHYVSWAPISTPKPDFHRPEFFGLLNFQPADK